MSKMKRLVVCCLIVIATFHFGTGNSTVYTSKTDNEIYNGKVVKIAHFYTSMLVGEETI